MAPAITDYVQAGSDFPLSICQCLLVPQVSNGFLPLEASLAFRFHPPTLTEVSYSLVATFESIFEQFKIVMVDGYNVARGTSLAASACRQVLG